MKKPAKSVAKLVRQNAELRLRLEEAEETLRAIRAGEVDALETGRRVHSRREVETPYRMLIEAMNEGAATLLEDGTIVYCNRRLVELLGSPLQELIGSSLSRFVAPAELPGFKALLARGKQYASKGEFNLQIPGAPAVPVQLSFSTLDGRVLCVIVTDVTEHKLAQAGLQRLAAIVESAEDAIVSEDLHGTILTWNPAAERFFGYRGEEMIGRDISQLIPENRPAEEAAVIEMARKGVRIQHYETIRHKKDGTPLAVSVTISPVRDAEGNILGVSKIMRDISERQRAEQRARMFSQEIVAAREEERRQVSSVLHHDVGSMAVGISAYLDAMEKDLRSEKPWEALKWMNRTRKLLDESVLRLKELAVDLRPPELDVLGLRAALRQHFSQITKQNGTQIHFRETQAKRVPADVATILFRVAQEALTNAIKHGQAKQVEVDLRSSKKDIRLTVRDNGKGFDPSELTTRARPALGLRVMREMAALAGGAFAVDSGRGQRTTVSVSLPRQVAGLGPARAAAQKGGLA
jgi:PAS domain S-box-containing protein